MRGQTLILIAVLVGNAFGCGDDGVGTSNDPCRAYCGERVKQVCVMESIDSCVHRCKLSRDSAGPCRDAFDAANRCAAVEGFRCDPDTNILWFNGCEAELEASATCYDEHFGTDGG